MLDFRVIRRLLEAHGAALDAPVKSFDIGGRTFDFHRHRYLTGVINLSPDSWYRESVCPDADAAIARGRQLMKEGAHLIDIGAESSLPDAERVDVAGQLDRLRPVVKTLVADGALVSVESYHPEVLDACGEAGAHVFNITGMKEAEAIFEVAARHRAALILCHVEGDNVREVTDLRAVGDHIPRLLEYFRGLIGQMEAAGVDRAFVDPGLGFYYRNLEDGTTRVRHQLDTFLETFRLAELGYPTFNIVPHAPHVFGEEERRSAEPFFSVLAFLGGTHMVRTHEVRRLARVLRALELYPSP
jgi:dihydropteroate synthase